VKIKLFTNFSLCQLLLDFSDQIVRHDNLSIHEPGSKAPSESSRIQIGLYDGHHVWFYSASDC
jgi:hypothetical protein